MSKNNSNLNNKFGECCNCPGLVNGDRMFNNYVSSRIRNDIDRKNLGMPDSHSYRNALQNGATFIINSEISRVDSLKCVSNDKNKFYIDSSKYNFAQPLNPSYTGVTINNTDIKKSHCAPIDKSCLLKAELHDKRRFQITPDKNC